MFTVRVSPKLVRQVVSTIHTGDVLEIEKSKGKYLRSMYDLFKQNGYTLHVYSAGEYMLAWAEQRYAWALPPEDWGLR